MNAASRTQRVWRFGEDVNTDLIVPGRHAPYMTSEADLQRAAFIEARPEFAQTVRPGDILIAGPNFGSGSSREYAAQALRLCQLEAIIAPSFARIFYRNALNLGLALVTHDAQQLEDGELVHCDLEAGRLDHAGGSMKLPPLPELARQLLAAGGLIPFVREHGRLPAEAGS